MRKLLGCFAFAALTSLLPGCASHHYVHWGDNLQGASRRAAELTQDRDARITPATGEAFEGRRLSFTRDSLSWTGPGSGEASAPRSMALADVDTVRLLRGNRAGLGAAMGAIAGASYVGLRCASDLICGQEYAHIAIAMATVYALFGSLFGLAAGSATPQWLYLVP